MLTDAPSGSHPPHLPRRLTPLLGREQELAQIRTQLLDPACHLLTLLGPGGMGKTRLAIEVATRLQDEFAAGVCFVNLQPLNDPAQLPTALADALHFPLSGPDSVESQLLRYLVKKELLLLFDNFEHLLAGTDFLSELLGQAAGLKALVTSRELLNLQEEWLFPLAGLAFPPIGFDLESLEQYAAATLFIDRMRRLRPHFVLAEEAAAVGRICQLVEGLPLALELAASWTKTLTCAEIAAEIDQGIAFLTTNLRNTPDRHRSMAAVFAQSWQQLTPQEQTVFARLSIFRGGFRREAAQVAGASLAILSRLVDKSLLRWEPGQGASTTGRYQIHELLRQYAAEKLAAQTEAATAARQQHSDYYLTFLRDRAPDLNSVAQRRALDEISLELDNIRTAWDWALTQHHLLWLDQSIDALYNFYQLRSRYGEAEALFAQAFQQLSAGILDADPALLRHVQQRLTVRLGAFRLHQGDLAEARTRLLAVRDQVRDPRELALLVMLLGTAARWRGDREDALMLLQQALTYARQGADPVQVAEALHGLGDSASAIADYRAGRHWAQEALAICREQQIPDLTARTLASLAWATNCLGNYAESEAHYREALAIFEAINQPFGVALTVQFLGWVAFCAGGERLPVALAHYQRALAIFRQIGHRIYWAMALADMAIAAVELGDYAAGLRYAQEGLSITTLLNQRTLQAYNLYGLGAAACGLGNLAASRHYFLHSLQITSTTQIFNQLLSALYYFTQLLIQEGQLPTVTAQERQQKRTLAVELLTIVIQHPATWQLFRDRAQRRLAELNAQAATNSRSVEVVVAELLGEVDWSSKPPPPVAQNVVVPASSSAASGNANLIEPLTERELEILHLIADGHTNQTIADKLILSPGTVKWYSSEIYGKLGVANRTQAVAEARRLQLIA
jgi:predicted ATPase/DNA-binding CsgD family transcriptional regulator